MHLSLAVLAKTFDRRRNRRNATRKHEALTKKSCEKLFALLAFAAKTDLITESKIDI